MIINPNNIEKWCFDYFEGNLTSLEQVEFEKFILEHPEFHGEFEAWKNASDSEDDNRIPAYFGAESLLVGAPFYATFAFKFSVGLVITLALGVAGYISLSSVEKEYVAKSNTVELEWSPKTYSRLAMMSFMDYTYGDYKIGTASSSNVSSPNDISFSEYLSENSADGLTGGVDENIETANQNESDDLSINDIAFKENQSIDQQKLLSQVEKLSSSYKEDDKSLYEHLGIDHSRYGFLNFNNSKVRGLGVKYSNKSNAKHGKNDNHSTITQTMAKNGKSSSHKKKSNFLQNLKNFELGLTNINDPISVAPNANVLGYNPALAGQLGIARLKFNLRNQWWRTDESLIRASAYFDTYIEKIQAGVGYGTEYDMSLDGSQRINKHMITYAQKISLSRNANVSIGITYELAKAENNSLSPNMLEFYPNSPISSGSLENQWKSNLGISSWYSGKYFFGGFNVTNLFGNTLTATHEGITSYINNVNYSVQLGTDYKQSMFAKTVVSPFVQYNKIGSHSDLWLGSIVRIKGIVLGGSVATSKSARATLGIQGNKFRLTMSSDYSKSLLLSDYAFSHELSMRILIGTKNNNWSRYDY